MSTAAYPTSLVAPAIVVSAKRVPEPTRKRWTREEYHRLGEQGWFQDQRVELIDGEIIILSPQSPQHVVGAERVRRVLERVFGDQYYVRHQGPMMHGDFSEPEPDVSVVRGSFEDYSKSHPTVSLLIVEVSRSSLKYDTQTK
jgi:Uma2 family endonuclease